MPLIPQNLGIPKWPSLPSNIKIRRATPGDAKEMKDVFFTSFNPSHKFWEVLCPSENVRFHDWWIKAWRMGIEDDPTAITFVAVDTAANDKVVGFSRWILPQENGNKDRLWPEIEDIFDMEIAGPFFGGMHENREKLMGVSPHWMLEMLGTDKAYEGQGIGQAFVSWGCDLADSTDLEVYIDASEKGAPFYQKHFNAIPKDPVILPDRPESYGQYTYVSHVIPRKSDRRAAE